MKHVQKIFFSASLLVLSMILASCSGIPGSQSSVGGGDPTGTFTIGGSITGLVGTGLVLQNGTDTLPVAAGSKTFVFTNKVASGGSYAVTVQTQPGTPAQTCVVTSGSGTATANVTTVSVTCTTNPVTAKIGGTLTNLATGSSVVLQNNGGDSLTIPANGTFTFKTSVTGPTDAYAVTVLTQPTTPNQICTVTNGSGTATADVTNVAVNCVLSYSVGGTVTGLVGTGFVLQNSSNLEQYTIPGNGAFAFKNLVPTGTAYTVTIATQPTGPTQTCVVTPSTASGTATSNVTTVEVTCKAVTYSVGGVVVGLEGQKITTAPFNNPLTDNSFSIINNLGDTKVIAANGPFTFATPVALNGPYSVTGDTNPSTQSQGCSFWNFAGTVTGNITNVVVDCAHNDWTWIDGTNTAGTIGSPQYGSFPQTAPTTIPNPYTNTPGARHSAAGWTDKFGNLWLFGGLGWELAGNPSPDTLDAPLNDMWVCQMTGDFCQWQLVSGYSTNAINIQFEAQHENQFGIYTGGSLGFPNTPGARYGAATWTDTGGNLWLFGGNGNSSTQNGLLNDLWKFDTTNFHPPALYTSAIGQWTWVGGPNAVNTGGTYTGAANTLLPGAREGAAYWTDASGNFWMFGGYGYDGVTPQPNVGFLSDLWEYTGTNWVFVSGNSTFNKNGTYGTPGTASSGNLPGGRRQAVSWADGNGHLWLFGGEGFDATATATGILNDLWMYDIATNRWTYVMGSTMANQTGTYELQPVIGPVSTVGAAGTCGLTVGDPLVPCQPVDTTGALPGSRWGAAGWVDAGGNFWLFGGWGLDSTGTNGNGALNDFWAYTPNVTAGQPGTWTWVKGSNTGNGKGIYGAISRPYFTYYIWTPGGRSNATHWVDGNGQLWLFGGEGLDAKGTNPNGFLNDLWRYLPYPD